jgi:hypothetical protein
LYQQIKKIKKMSNTAVSSTGASTPSVLATAGIRGNGKFFVILKNTSNSVKRKIVLFPDAYEEPATGENMYGVGSALGSASGNVADGITFESTMDMHYFNKFFTLNAMSIPTMALSTNNVENFNNQLNIKDSRKKFLGINDAELIVTLQGSRVAIGNSWGETIPEVRLDLVKDAFIGVVIDKIEPNSYVRMEFVIDGIDNGYNLIPA